MPKTPKIPGGEKTTAFLSPQNRAHLQALGTARGHPMVVVLDDELNYLNHFGLSIPVRARLLGDATKKRMALRDYVQEVLIHHAGTLPQPPGLVAASQPQGDTIKTSITLAPDHHKRLTALGAEKGHNLSIVINDELNFARTFGLPLPYLARLERQAKQMGISLRDIVNFLLVERFGSLPPEPAEPTAPADVKKRSGRLGK